MTEIEQIFDANTVLLIRVYSPQIATELESAIEVVVLLDTVENGAEYGLFFKTNITGSTQVDEGGAGAHSVNYTGDLPLECSW